MKTLLAVTFVAALGSSELAARLGVEERRVEDERRAIAELSGARGRRLEARGEGVRPVELLGRHDG